MRPLVADLVAPYIDADAAFVRFVSCTARSLVPHPRHHWERRFAPLLRALAAGDARFAVRVRPLHAVFGEPELRPFPPPVVVDPRLPLLVRQLREAEDRLDELFHPAYVTLEIARHRAGEGFVAIAVR